MTVVDVTPERVIAAAQAFARAQGELETAWTRLQGVLDANAGMAGNDKPAHTFVGKYEPGVKAAWAAFGKAFTIIGGIAIGLTQTVNNHLKADHHSKIRRPRAPHRYPAPGVADAMSMAMPGSAIGSGHSLLPGPLAKYWPNGHQDKLHAAAAAWRTAATTVDGIGSRLTTTINGITDGRDHDSRAISAYWARVYAPCNSRTVLGGLPEACREIAAACDRFASVIDHAHSQVEHKLAEVGIAVGVTSLAAGLLTPFTGGASDAAGGALDAAEAAAILGPVEAETLAAASDTAAAISELAGTIEGTVGEATTIEAVEAETTELQSAIDEELAEAEGAAKPTRLEGKRDYVVDDPAVTGRTITDIDHIQDGVLWEEKSATNAGDIGRWVAKHIDKKFSSYLDARQYMAGYEDAPIGFRFTSSGADPAFRSTVESAVERLRLAHPDVRILLEWS